MFLNPITNSTLLTPKKICRDCKYFIHDGEKCNLFYKTDLVTGIKTYEYADKMRTSIDKCGENAIYFQENNFKFIIAPYYFTKQYLPFLFLISFYILYMYEIIHLSNHSNNP
jgi:predicted PolB exonuclease-like 3'-5' exonuclease